jgi:hypothetical protein
MSEIVNSLSKAGLHIEWMHEFDWLFFESAEKKQVKNNIGKWVYPEYAGKMPFTFFLKAVVR